MPSVSSPNEQLLARVWKISLGFQCRNAVPLFASELQAPLPQLLLQTGVGRAPAVVLGLTAPPLGWRGDLTDGLPEADEQMDRKEDGGKIAALSAET